MSTGTRAMPTSPPHYCAMPSCPALVPSGQARCLIHAPSSAHGWRNDDQRIRGRRLQRLRDQLFTSEPLCRACKAAGRTALATIRDHIVPLAEGGTDEPSNIQPLCRECSDRKTQQEAQRGRWAGGGRRWRTSAERSPWPACSGRSFTMSR